MSVQKYFVIWQRKGSCISRRIQSQRSETLHVWFVTVSMLFKTHFQIISIWLRGKIICCHPILYKGMVLKCDQAGICSYWVLKDRIQKNDIFWTLYPTKMLQQSNSSKIWPSCHDWRTTWRGQVMAEGETGYWRQQWKANWWKATN